MFSNVFDSILIRYCSLVEGALLTLLILAQCICMCVFDYHLMVIQYVKRRTEDVEGGRNRLTKFKKNTF